MDWGNFGSRTRVEKQKLLLGQRIQLMLINAERVNLLEFVKLEIGVYTLQSSLICTL